MHASAQSLPAATTTVTPAAFARSTASTNADDTRFDAEIDYRRKRNVGNDPINTRNNAAHRSGSVAIKNSHRMQFHILRDTADCSANRSRDVTRGSSATLAASSAVIVAE